MLRAGEARTSRRLPEVQESLAPLLANPLDRALLAIETPPAESAPCSPASPPSTAAIDVPGVAELEALGDATWWVPAAPDHAACTPAREQAGPQVAVDRALSGHELPVQASTLAPQAAAALLRTVSSGSWSESRATRSWAPSGHRS